jgi:hypothetical protein
MDSDWLGNLYLPLSIVYVPVQYQERRLQLGLSLILKGTMRIIYGKTHEKRADVLADCDAIYLSTDENRRSTTY